MTPNPVSWLDQQKPFSARQSQAQIGAVLKLLGPKSRRVLDLGCGSGRVLARLAEAGHTITGIDRDAAALAECRERVRGTPGVVNLIHGDFFAMGRMTERFDAVLCLGNTFMTVWDVDAAVRLLTAIRSRLTPHGRVIIDDLPASFFEELTEGRWQSGLSPDGRMQMVWHPTDAVFTIRTGKRINQRSWSLRPSDVRFRLWCDGSLAVVAQRAGLSAPMRRKNANLLVMTRAAGADGFTRTSPRRRTTSR